MSAHVRELGRELGAPILVCLEGGYDPVALAGSALATVAGAAGRGAARADRPGGLVADAVERVRGLEPLARSLLRDSPQAVAGAGLPLGLGPNRPSSGRGASRRRPGGPR